MTKRVEKYTYIRGYYTSSLTAGMRLLVIFPLLWACMPEWVSQTVFAVAIACQNIEKKKNKGQVAQKHYVAGSDDRLDRRVV